MSSEQQSQAAPSGAASAHEQLAAEHLAVVSQLATGLDLVTVIAEATDGVSVWYASESVPAHQYDEHELIRDMAEMSVRMKLADVLHREGDPGLVITVKTDRWTMDLGSEDPV